MGSVMGHNWEPNRQYSSNITTKYNKITILVKYFILSIHWIKT